MLPNDYTSKKRIASELGVSPAAVGQWWRGYTLTARRGTLEKLKKFLADEWYNLNQSVSVDEPISKFIVDPRFANAGYRDTVNEQNCVGTTLSPGDEQIHFIPP